MAAIISPNNVLAKRISWCLLYGECTSSRNEPVARTALSDCEFCVINTATSSRFPRRNVVMANQENVFLSGEADAWYERNKNLLENKSTDKDPIYQYLQANKQFVQNKVVLEVGCSNGYRLSWLKSNFSSKVIGFDPSSKAIEAGSNRFNLKVPSELFVMGAGLEFWTKSLRENFSAQSIDCIIFGHSLYLVPPDQLPQIVATTDFLLKQDGIVAIFDFDSLNQRRPYHHTPGEEVYSYKMDYSKLFDWIPYYRLIFKSVTEHSLAPSKGNPHEDCAISVLRKVPRENAYPQLV